MINKHNGKIDKDNSNKKGIFMFLKENIAIILLVVGLMIMTYPFMAEYVKGIQDSKLVNDFRSSKSSGSSFDGFKDAMKEYNEKIQDGVFNSNSGNLSFDIEDEDRDENENKSIIDQESVLDASGDNKVIGTLIIPRIEEEIAIYYGSNSRVLQKGAGILENTSYPGINETSHSIITGHRGTHNAKIFRDLDKMEVGDHFYIETVDDVLKYQTYDIEIVDPDLVQLLGIEEGRDLVTLLTCHPFLINSQRLLVKAERKNMLKSDYDYLGIILNENQGVEVVQKNMFNVFDNVLFIVLLIINLLAVLFLLYVIKKFIKDNESR